MSYSLCFIELSCSCSSLPNCISELKNIGYKNFSESFTESKRGVEDRTKYTLVDPKQKW